MNLSSNLSQQDSSFLSLSEEADERIKSIFKRLRAYRSRVLWKETCKCSIFPSGWNDRLLFWFVFRFALKILLLHKVLESKTLTNFATGYTERRGDGGEKQRDK